MDAKFSPKTDQRARVKPISFALERFGQVGEPVMLAIRPEDLTRTEPSRVMVHQTLDKDIQGWVDSFGRGLPTITIAGHTGWGYKPGLGKDGFQSFEALNKLVAQDFHIAKQAAIDSGNDPEQIKLLFIDILDGFACSAVPTQFVLRRSKSRPLLFQYNISLQVLSMSAAPAIPGLPPSLGDIPSGLAALADAVETITESAEAASAAVQKVASVASTPAILWKTISDSVKLFMLTTASIFNAVSDVVKEINNAIKSKANQLIGLANMLANAGNNIFKTISSIASIPATIKHAISKIGSVFSAVMCIFQNSLRPRPTYDQYSGLYGASNCSSTTGGRPASVFAGQNPFALMQPDRPQFPMTSDGLNSLNMLSRADPVLSPMPVAELSRHLSIVNSALTA